jgi:hypothetical protein
MAVAAGGIALIVILAVALVVAIASSGDNAANPDEDSPGVFLGPGGEGFERPDPEVVEEFRACMEDHGVEVPEPGTAPPSDSDRLQQAFAACSDLLPEDIRPPGGPSGSSGPFIFPGDE